VVEVIYTCSGLRPNNVQQIGLKESITKEKATLEMVDDIRFSGKGKYLIDSGLKADRDQSLM
jgi:hypothetical protein